MKRVNGKLLTAAAAVVAGLGIEAVVTAAAPKTPAPAAAKTAKVEPKPAAVVHPVIPLPALRKAAALPLLPSILAHVKSSGPVVVALPPQAVRPPYRPPARSPFRPPGRPPFAGEGKPPFAGEPGGPHNLY
ncbi:MAG TPA: hypothetical protein VH475_15755 [Tepidisphaeraceae bacterium]